ncbi:3-oxoacyl-[acyl-carrier-protein] synthase III [Caminicella sporogenes DSM 14501]|uniref:Beta-ketoacyl-[acyl-carrier-protein] synthase III n=1 Tax=Caminicella sporogenes DSM 14501 TaxID=1121266 RepID=A0A1M6LFG5_9FIRM|nr:beta-ketoacyl-ACP synthase III [Caminicella sporogenes]RKD27817.1 3-oxoacyl-ACP synthase [Caminicella sporogenes]SHJ69971.1 3-oxoacyl-[acyl-carrier-protein] synthase III [Caminicella sporogenes DSM 14501]
MNNVLQSVGILGTGSYLPEKEITNFDLEKMVDTSNDWIVSRTGIHTRRIADDSTATSDLATMAARKALEMANIKPEDLDLIIVATVTPDMAFPSTACIVQSNLGAANAAAFDLEAGCSGFLYGMTVGKQFIATGVYKYVLVIGAETLSKIMDWNDRNTCVLFGDGAGAVVLGPVEEGRGILSTYLGADGEKGKFLTQPAGGSRMPASIETVKQNLHYIKMDGSEVFKFAVRIMGDASKEALKLCNLNVEDVDYLVPHQANIRIILSAAKRLKLSMDKVYVNLDKYGNMSAASIPVALDEAVKQNKIRENDIVVLVGFGAGLTWGSCVVKW